MHNTVQHSTYPITLAAGLRNNLAYSRYFYTTTRALYPHVQLVFVSYGSTDGTHEWLDSLHDDNVKYWYSAENKSLSHTYNKAAELADCPYMAFMHNDMVIAPGFMQALAANCQADTVQFFTVTEPPLFAEDKHAWKITHDFGRGIEDFDLAGFRKWAAARAPRVPEATTDKCFFMCLPRQAFINTGGMDTLYSPMFAEDDDILLRLQYAGMRFVQNHNALVYHFISKTSRYSAEYAAKTQAIEKASLRNFARKWGFNMGYNVHERRNIGLVYTGSSAAVIHALEPWYTTIYTQVPVAAYIAAEQPQTLYNLQEKFKPAGSTAHNDVLVSFSGSKPRKRQLYWLQRIPQLIERHSRRRNNLLYRLFTAAHVIHSHGIKVQLFKNAVYNRSLISISDEGRLGVSDTDE